mmetsp:Transcript_120290/g.256755  ORF Transcript_120290/g.256755 Transcript_120290/m.256755 type:complete len:475 (-) Transcript_120290:90-1514(-)
MPSPQKPRDFRLVEASPEPPTTEKCEHEPMMDFPDEALPSTPALNNPNGPCQPGSASDGRSFRPVASPAVRLTGLVQGRRVGESTESPLAQSEADLSSPAVPHFQFLSDAITTQVMAGQTADSAKRFGPGRHVNAKQMPSRTPAVAIGSPLALASPQTEEKQAKSKEGQPFDLTSLGIPTEDGSRVQPRKYRAPLGGPRPGASPKMRATPQREAAWPTPEAEPAAAEDHPQSIQYLHIPRHSLQDFRIFAKGVTLDAVREVATRNPYVVALCKHREELQSSEVVGWGSTWNWGLSDGSAKDKKSMDSCMQEHTLTVQQCLSAQPDSLSALSVKEQLDGTSEEYHPVSVVEAATSEFLEAACPQDMETVGCDGPPFKPKSCQSILSGQCCAGDNVYESPEVGVWREHFAPHGQSSPESLVEPVPAFSQLSSINAVSPGLVANKVAMPPALGGMAYTTAPSERNETGAAYTCDRHW